MRRCCSFLSLVLLVLCSCSCCHGFRLLLPRHPRRPTCYSATTAAAPPDRSETSCTTSTGVSESPRLQRARLRIAEAQGRVPWGTSDLTEKMFKEFFDPSEAAVFTGGPDVAAAFSALPFDHLLFTGSTQTGKLVMKSASENLVPVTLELGGKSPVIVSDTSDVRTSSKRIIAGKTMNAGQICLAPDYVLIERHMEMLTIDVPQL